MKLLRITNSQPFNDTEEENYKANINRLESQLTHTKALIKELIELLNKTNNYKPIEIKEANHQENQDAYQAEKTIQNKTKQQSKGKQHDLKMI